MQSARPQVVSEKEFLFEMYEATEELTEIMDDIDAQTREEEKIKSVRKLVSFTNDNIPKFIRLNVNDTNLSVCAYLYVEGLNYFQTYANYEISYLETGDLNDKHEADLNLRMGGNSLISSADLIEAYQNDKLQKNTFVKIN